MHFMKSCNKGRVSVGLCLFDIKRPGHRLASRSCVGIEKWSKGFLDRYAEVCLWVLGLVVHPDRLVLEDPSVNCDVVHTKFMDASSDDEYSSVSSVFVLFAEIYSNSVH